ncbi:hypothetical protein DSM104443_04082 [Usitatibacter rugosus]|uniref:Knr4/Smi1-like domain-containing protein n=1 Tax=Usitatibacter rugosus TaxID=2732067 RepID=A0A6M4H1I0_9PROT|nr:SMI1/KNR4 family protein [Usitatibacter rugosus]QJR12988.1 hypothetical protein DSM104443_04082 [Usitatibacter rugosus]
MGIFGFLKIALGTANIMRERQALAAELAALPMAAFIPRWIALRSSAAGLGRPQVRPPATQLQLVTARARLGLTLPAELQDFLRVTDGITWVGSFNEQPIASADVLAFGSATSLAASVRAHWESEGRETEDPMGLQVFNESLVEIMADAHDKLLPFSDLDDFLVLQPLHEGQAVAMIARPHKYYPAGTVLRIEGNGATRHGTLRAWLASDATLLASPESLKAAR